MIDVAPTEHTDEQQREVRFFRILQRLGWFWTAIIYISLSLSVHNVWSERPALLRGWWLVGLAVLLGAFLALYHRVYMPSTTAWPMPPRRAVIYFSGQLVVLTLLLRYNINFGSLGFALLAHIVSTLRPKHWPIPILGVILLLGAPFGVYGQVLDGNWIALIDFGFNTAIILAMFITISLLFGQRFQLVDTVRELRHAKQQLETQAAQAEELAALRERTRLARDMHDSIGHALVVVNVKLEAAQRLYAVDAQRGSAELDATKTLVRDTMADLRRSLAGLRAPLFDHHDLPAALHHLAADTRQRSQLQITCSTTVDAPPLAPAATEALWRVAREALANVERHAHATHATLSLERQNGSIVLHIADNGAGFSDQALDRAGHYGVVGMRERVEALGGVFQIARRAEGGTVVEAHVPINNKFAVTSDKVTP